MKPRIAAAGRKLPQQPRFLASNPSGVPVVLPRPRGTSGVHEADAPRGRMTTSLPLPIPTQAPPGWRHPRTRPIRVHCRPGHVVYSGVKPARGRGLGQGLGSPAPPCSTAVACWAARGSPCLRRRASPRTLLACGACWSPGSAEQLRHRGEQGRDAGVRPGGHLERATGDAGTPAGQGPRHHGIHRPSSRQCVSVRGTKTVRCAEESQG